MKAIITGGGRATRLRPITWTINKHLIPIANKPMIFYAIEKIRDAGIKEIAINVNPGDKELAEFIGDGSRWGVKINYFEQQGGPLGIANVVWQARDFIGDEPFLFYLGDNIILNPIKNFVEKFQREKLNCLLALSRVKDPQRFGVPEIRGGKIVRVEEKPIEPKSDFAVTGIYFYDKNFFEAYKHVKPSARGEYEISDVHTWLIENGCNVGYEEITGWWKDTGKPEDLLEANQLILNNLQEEECKNGGEITGDVIIQGKVKIGKNTKIGPRVTIRGPVAVGENCVIANTHIGPHTSLGNGVEIYNSEIEHSIVFDDVDINCGVRIVDSLIGKNAMLLNSHETLPNGHRLVVGDNAVVEL
jgi:glucose-1-phosphate thymidylyltransferase